MDNDDQVITTTPHDFVEEAIPLVIFNEEKKSKLSTLFIFL